MFIKVLIKWMKVQWLHFSRSLESNLVRSRSSISQRQKFGQKCLLFKVTFVKRLSIPHHRLMEFTRVLKPWRSADVDPPPISPLPNEFDFAERRRRVMVTDSELREHAKRTHRNLLIRQLLLDHSQVINSFFAL